MGDAPIPAQNVTPRMKIIKHLGIILGIIVSIYAVFFLFFDVSLTQIKQIETEKIADVLSGERNVSIWKYTDSLEDPRLYSNCEGFCVSYRGVRATLKQKENGFSVDLVISAESGRELARKELKKTKVREWRMFALGNDIIIYAAPEYYSGILDYRIQEKRLETISFPRGFSLLIDRDCPNPRNSPATTCRDHAVFVRENRLIALGSNGKLLIHNLTTNKDKIVGIGGNPLLKIWSIFIAQDNSFYIYESEDIFGAEVRRGKLDFTALDI